MHADPTELQSAVLDLVARTLDMERSMLDASLTLEDLGLDSLDVLKLTTALERRFDIELGAYSYVDISSLDRLTAILRTELSRIRLAT